MKKCQLQKIVTDLYDNELILQPLEQRLADPKNRAYNHFHCDYTGSDAVLMCVGDSWTKGTGLDLHSDQFRLEKIFGSQLNHKLGTLDFLNLGGNGQSNSWCMTQMEFVMEWMNRSDYKTGYVIITFTENGRDVKNYSHRKFDYIAAYGHLCIEQSFYDQMLDDIEQEWITRLQDFRRNLHQRFHIICGQNFIWHERLFRETSMPGIHWVPNSWVEHLADRSGKSPPPRTRMTSLNQIEVVNSILSIGDLEPWYQWFLRNIDAATEVLAWMGDTPEYFEKHDLGHPNSEAHTVWADVLFATVKSLVH